MNLGKREIKAREVLEVRCFVAAVALGLKPPGLCRERGARLEPRPGRQSSMYLDSVSLQHENTKLSMSVKWPKRRWEAQMLTLITSGFL